mmetsp:Transcript_48663/g.97507  ORF Transcript_48663/g.97507 Transcript_48663/m.97507 type:complete len:262 (+) Transcript_48663:19-804(+)
MERGMHGYGAMGEGPGVRSPAAKFPRLFMAGLVAVATVAVVGAYTVVSLSGGPVEQLQIGSPQDSNSVHLQTLFPASPANNFPKLAQALDGVVRPATSFQLVDHSQLAQILKEHLLEKQALASYPFGYPRSGGWHQVIENYSPEGDGCDCGIDEGARELRCSCGSVWGAVTLMDQNCYGCCETGCCNHCTCSGIDEEEAEEEEGRGDGKRFSMGPTTCSCPLAERWTWHDECSWWSDNAGPLDPGGTGGIPDVEDQPGVLT